MCVCVLSFQRRATSRFLQLNICLIYHGVHIVAHNEMLLRKINSWWQHWSAASLNSFQSAPKTWLVIQMNGESSTATMGKKNKTHSCEWPHCEPASRERTATELYSRIVLRGSQHCHANVAGSQRMRRPDHAAVPLPTCTLAVEQDSTEKTTNQLRKWSRSVRSLKKIIK